MKISFKSLLLLAAFGTFATTSCSEKTQENAEATADSAATDAANNTQQAADATSNAVDNAAENVKADAAPEKGDTAVVVEKTTTKLVEETK
jgi:Flp pilus assembly protein TadG